ncbi:MAG TPA: hypothetical protein P5279_06715 [Anaerohalosphaeraceae bacterium]|jgi:hypothetical protein|nr:hypothetical protein [Anaerohalosphaeraceae bacterium]HRT50165.1 hypothetical protein [Anaerohalosphaeraceae bacterium]HRT86096.1 hypothetical protein [Anaerohalosphaeraceae bacterium]
MFTFGRALGEALHTGVERADRVGPFALGNIEHVNTVAAFGRRVDDKFDLSAVGKVDGVLFARDVREVRFIVGPLLEALASDIGLSCRPGRRDS